MRLSEQVLSGIDGIAASLGTPRSAVIRLAIDEYVAHHEARGANLNRVAMTSEFSQLALASLLKHFKLGTEPAILAEVEQRMGKYHAAR